MLFFRFCSDTLFYRHSLASLISQAEAYDFSHEDLCTEEEVDLVASFAQLVQDYGDLWNDMEFADRVRTTHLLQEEVETLSEKGYWVFANSRQISFRFGNKVVPLTAIVIRVLHDNSPEIISKRIGPEAIFRKMPPDSRNEGGPDHVTVGDSRFE